VEEVRIIDLSSFPYGGKERRRNGSVSPTDEGFKSFYELFFKELKKVNNLQLNADSMAKKLATGELKDIHQLTIAVEKADIALRLITEIRNRLVDAYQQISRMTM